MPAPLHPVIPALADRYAILLDLVASVPSLVPSALFPAVYAQVSRPLPLAGLTAAGEHAEGAQGWAFQAGEGEPVEPSRAELKRLRAGEPVVRSAAGTRLPVLAVPLLHGDAYLGWLAVRLRESISPEAEDARFLVAVGRLVGAALENARHAAEASRRSEEAERLDELARELTGSLELAAVVERVASRAHDMAGQPVVLWLVEGERTRAAARAGRTSVRLGEERLLSAEVLRSLEASSPHAGTEVPADERVVIPLTLGSRTIGLLELGPGDGRALEPERLRLLRHLAPHAASAVDNARLHAEVRRLSLTDPLVQLPNRRQLDLYLEREVAAAARGRPLAMALYDLDRFKEYNDTHGHRAGDLALVRFASVLRAETRAMNLAVRYGGEEFATVLSGADLEGGRAHAERVRARVREAFGDALTVSAGVAEWHPTMERPADLIVAADRALYRAKLEGRDRVNVAES